MKTINVNSKQYVLEFTFEAAMHEACVENVIGLIDGMAIAQANNDVNGYVSGIAKAPKTVINMMYAGLLEHHGNEIKTVKNLITRNSSYSLEEVEVGVWVDGETPVYQRTFIGEASSNTAPEVPDVVKDVLLQDASFMELIMAFGKVNNTSGSQTSLGYTAGAYGAQVYVSNNSLVLQHTLDIVGKYIITVEYIKK